MKTQGEKVKKGEGKPKFTESEKLSILKEAELKGVRATLDKYDLFPATYYYWKKKVQDAGDEGLKHGMTKERFQEIKRLQEENQMLKKIIGENALEAKLKDELLAKKYPTWNLKKG
jgi:putative transposase